MGGREQTLASADIAAARGDLSELRRGGVRGLGVDSGLRGCSQGSWNRLPGGGGLRSASGGTQMAK